jgi:toxin ParE1/3/4
MSFSVLITDDAARDLEDLYDYIAWRDSFDAADYVLDAIEKVFSSLAEQPERGHYPIELLAVGIREYREVLFKPYRILYRVGDGTVTVYLVADGRRDMQQLLHRRLVYAEG